VNDGELIAVLESGRTFTVQIPGNESPDEALNVLSGRIARGAPVPAWAQWPWLDTEERFRIRRDAIVALVVGHKEGEWAVAA
jgi:hypothetical protein